MIEVTLPEVQEARKAIFVRDKKKMQLDQPGVHRGEGPDGKVIKLTQNEIDGALEAVRDALQEMNYLKEEAWPEQIRKIDAMKVASDDLRAQKYPEPPTLRGEVPPREPGEDLSFRQKEERGVVPPETESE